MPDRDPWRGFEQWAEDLHNPPTKWQIVLRWLKSLGIYLGCIVLFAIVIYVFFVR